MGIKFNFESKRAVTIRTITKNSAGTKGTRPSCQAS